MSSAKKRKLKYFDIFKQFEKWTDAYMNVKRSANLCDTVFRAQLAIMITTITLYYIILLYGITSFNIERGKFSVVKSLSYLISLFGFLIALLLLSKAGQRIQKSAENLRRKLSKFLLHSLEDPEFHRAATNLLRLVCTHHIKMRCFGFIDIDMTLLPSCLMFVTSYTVIALQFNNVV
ncbi:uncharacterized protein LOC134200511 [Bombyx mori]